MVCTTSEVTPTKRCWRGAAGFPGMMSGFGTGLESSGTHSAANCVRCSGGSCALCEAPCSGAGCTHRCKGRCHCMHVGLTGTVGAGRVGFVDESGQIPRARAGQRATSAPQIPRQSASSPESAERARRRQVTVRSCVRGVLQLRSAGAERASQRALDACAGPRSRTRACTVISCRAGTFRARIAAPARALCTVPAGR